MPIRWYGQSAFLLKDDDITVFVDPFGDMAGLRQRGLRFDDSTRVDTTFDGSQSGVALPKVPG